MSTPTLEDVHNEYAKLNVANGRFFAALLMFTASLVAPYMVYNGFSIEEYLGDLVPKNTDAIFAIGVPALALLLVNFMSDARERQAKRFNKTSDDHDATLIGMGGLL